MATKTRKNPRGGNAPAYPQGLMVGKPIEGLTKREWMATICLQGILAAKGIHKYTVCSLAQHAVMYADELIEVLEHGVSDRPTETAGATITATAADLAGAIQPTVAPTC